MSALQLRCPRSKSFLQRVMAACERIAPLKLADSSWDNVGLIAESPLPLRNSLVLVTNDLSLAVVQEAVQKQASVIISYHPPWFKAAKTINCTGALANLSYCIAHGISVYSPHTALDAIKGGINDWMLKAFDGFANFDSVIPIQPTKFDPESGAGYGRLVKLNRPVSITEACDLIKSHFGLKFVRIGYKRNYNPDEKDITSIAVCAGSGGSVFAGVKADLFLTGEMGHHQALELCDRAGAYVVLTEHSNCERGYLKGSYVARLKEELSSSDADSESIEVLFSEIDSDPLQIA